MQATIQAKSSHIFISPDIVKNIGADNGIEIINDSINHKINSFEIKSSLPINTIVYPFYLTLFFLVEIIGKTRAGTHRKKKNDILIRLWGYEDEFGLTSVQFFIIVECVGGYVGMLLK